MYPLSTFTIALAFIFGIGLFPFMAYFLYEQRKGIYRSMGIRALVYVTWWCSFLYILVFLFFGQ
jgi:hypothetical protein